MLPMLQDNSQRFICHHQHWRGEIVRLGESYQTIMRQHGYPQPIQHVLGEALLSATLMASALKFAGQVTLQFQSEGPLQLLVAKCDHDLNIRGLAQWHMPATSSELADALLQGTLVMTLEQHKQAPYQSIVAIEQDSISSALERYFTQSEQVPTLFRLAADDQHAVGVMLQLLPEALRPPEQNDAWIACQQQMATLQAEPLLSWNTPDLINFLQQDQDVRLFDWRPVKFYCPCSIQRMQAALVTMGQQEVMQILDEKQVVDVTCEYCSHHYAFSREEVLEIFSASP